MDATRITVVCFAASYALAFTLDALALAWRGGGSSGGKRRLLTIALAAAGVVAHAGYLAMQASRQATPLSSPADWYSLAALALAAIYVSASFAWPRWAVGVFLLPVVLTLVAVATTASAEPFAPDRASWFWGQAHGWTLLLATVTVTLGFVSGAMYLVQSWRLKRKLPDGSGLTLPSLEWLERTNTHALALAAWLVAGGFLSGLVLSTLKNRGVEGYHLWADPVVLTLGATLSGLLAAQAYRLLAPAANHGRRVAYLAVAAFALLAATLTSLTLTGAVHGTKQTAADESAGSPSVGRLDRVSGMADPADGGDPPRGRAAS